MMAVRGIDNRRFSYGQSGVSNQLYYYGSGRIGVTEDRNCQSARSSSIMETQGLWQPLF